MQVLQVILNVIIFLLCLSFVVCIHEAGHLSMAKLFKVYCFEYSIGFGPKIFSKRFIHRKLKGKPFYGTPVFSAEQEEAKEKALALENSAPTDAKDNPLLSQLDDSEKDILEEKPKKKKAYHFKDTDKYNYYEGETAFSIRALPLGGYVAMAGEDNEENELGIVVSKERTLTGVNHLKQIVIMLAGITMNFILAILLLLVDYGLCPQTKYNYDTTEIAVSRMTNNEESEAYKAGLRTGDKILTLYQVYHLKDEKTGEEVERIFPEGWDKDAPTLTKYINSDAVTPDDYDTDSIAYAIQDVVSRNMLSHDYEGTNNAFSAIESFEGLYADKDSTREIHLTYSPIGEVEKSAVLTLGTTLTEEDEGSYYTFQKMGITCKTTTFHYSASQAFSLSFQQFGYLFVSIFQALGSLFTPSGWKSMGGIISVYRVSASGVESGSLSFFIYLWAYISINLGCFNLLPFPGLDGWQTLIALGETVTRKKASTKFKGIANAIGMILLFLLAGLLLIKDILNPII